MKAHLTESLIQSLGFTGKQYDVYDTTQKGLILRVNAKEGKTYTAQYKRGGRIKIAQFGEITLKVARLNTMQIIGEAKNNSAFNNKAKTESNITYSQFLEDIYYPKIKDCQRGADASYKMLITFFAPLFGHRKLVSLDPDTDSLVLKEWVKTKLKSGVKKSTSNRYIAKFKASINDAVKEKLIKQNPFQSVSLFPKAENERTRYLMEAERACFFKNLAEFPKLFQTVVKIAMFSGLRRQEVLTLEWKDVNLEDSNPTITVRSENSKNGVSRILPINKTLLEALLQWRSRMYSQKNCLLFVNSETGKRFHDFRRQWARLCKMSDLKDFRWHDMRHEFATSLLKQGVDLYTIQKLLGHLDSDMTRRYTHIADKMLANAVAKLD